ncbi:hypothetical protein [Actinopolyspora halophila]|uniref:hypothetical protein n=1 Tax=Actinopolyspora halophila TaxID=1850 RepID=UPI00037BCD5A|nr:hypothetical protein [Actinopolyspora halophila]
MTDAAPYPSELPQREPQTSEGAQLDRRLSWSGQLVDPATPCTDVHLLIRVRDLLRAQQ